MLIEFEGRRPRVAETAFVAPTAVLIGNVIVHDDASVWFGAVLRSDHGEREIVVGARSNVQDNCVIHVSEESDTVLGEDVTIGHGAILEGCVIGNGALVGMNAVVLEGAEVGERALIAAGSTVLGGTRIPAEHLAAGVPAAVKKPIAGAARRWIEHSAGHYVTLARRYKEAGLAE